ncbi:L-histidine N(alpha)-methyltransferase [Mucilaginibacter sp. KACC 22063]|uniref:L-histidine N(alpha)-methyltransferase n=1 Tax=Mucilaginibacter sp. KACC 22063 TaxID=3025666 RepID=UPI0023660429|nr:L-histidine N(alpha)-methyltransferase [Mucilaginibacter sp. KACC 22063]WDF55042.1 L-histidine N(alpha)-methyltransferase [Mucilaginibacter sp. KACC 22063]
MQPVKNLHLNDQSDITNGQFCRDVIEGLSSVPKHLDAKYFYDAKGDELFQQIMNMPEYYPTDCEMEIFSEQTADLSKLLKDDSPFDLIELGAGDATKSIHLLRGLVNSHADFNYVPIDISGHVIDLLNETLPPAVPGLKVEGIQGDYFEALDKAQHYSNRRKVVLFLGSNIGNMPVADAEAFCKNLRKYLSPGDMLLVGFDLKKDPKVILDAYNDKQGITKQFNINLLHRINNELGADFKPDQFEHYATYDPETGACKSYLISLCDQNISLCDETFDFKKDEYIYMEVSQKYTVEQTRRMAIQAGFKPLQDFYDSKGWFLDTVWLAL